MSQPHVLLWGFLVSTSFFFEIESKYCIFYTSCKDVNIFFCYTLAVKLKVLNLNSGIM